MYCYLVLITICNMQCIINYKCYNKYKYLKIFPKIPEIDSCQPIGWLFII